MTSCFFLSSNSDRIIKNNTGSAPNNDWLFHLLSKDDFSNMKIVDFSDGKNELNAKNFDKVFSISLELMTYNWNDFVLKESK